MGVEKLECSEREFSLGLIQVHFQLLERRTRLQVRLVLHTTQLPILASRIPSFLGQGRKKATMPNPKFHLALIITINPSSSSSTADRKPTHLYENGNLGRRGERRMNGVGRRGKKAAATRPRIRRGILDTTFFNTIGPLLKVFTMSQKLSATYLI